MRRALIWVGGLVTLLLAVTIVIHIPAVQRRVGACPFGYDKPRTAAATARAPRTGPVAPARLALGRDEGAYEAELELQVARSGS